MASSTAFLVKTLLMWSVCTIISCEYYVYKCSAQDGDNYVCDAQWLDFNITKEFENLKATLPPNRKQLKRLEIRNSYIEEIPEDVFLDISFTEVSIFEAQNLTRIHSKAFNFNTIFHLKEFSVIGSTKLRNYPPDYNLYKALNSLINAVRVEISLEAGYYSHEIPDNAFKYPQKYLKYLAFHPSDYNISRIGNYAFSGLSALTTLSLNYVPIEKIYRHAFDFNSGSSERLTLQLNGRTITDSSLENEVFSNVKRPMAIYLIYTPLDYIREEKFGNFLRRNQQNHIILYGNYLNCNDVNPFMWLIKNRDKFRNQILGGGCENGTNFWDLNIDDLESTIPSAKSYKFTA